MNVAFCFFHQFKKYFNLLRKTCPVGSYLAHVYATLSLKSVLAAVTHIDSSMALCMFLWKPLV